MPEINLASVEMNRSNDPISRADIKHHKLSHFVSRIEGIENVCKFIPRSVLNTLMPSIHWIFGRRVLQPKINQHAA